jgi:hypothetical protein
MFFQVIQMVYWLTLSTWFGGALFIAIAAPIIYQTVQKNNPILPHVLSVNLDGEHGHLLSDTIVANMISALSNVELICAGGLALALGGQWVTLDIHDPANLASLIIRTALLLGGAGAVAYDRWILRPKISKFRQEFTENADDPEKANPARDQFNHFHQSSLLLLQIMVVMLLGLVLLSAAVHQPAYIFTAAK